MRRYEFTFQSLNSEAYSKPIRVLVVAPDRVGTNTHAGTGTGAMLFSHGWGGNRFQYERAMIYSAERYDLVCVSVEYRQSGFDFDAATGRGALRPYDASHYQVADVLNGLRAVLDREPGIDRRRLFSYGGSQGGHITLLNAIYAPNTFAFTYAACPVTHLDERFQLAAGRAFADFELAARNVIALADCIKCPVYLEHGTADESVPHDRHMAPLVERLAATGKLAKITYYEGGGHMLAPVTTRYDTFLKTAPGPMSSLTNEAEDDFSAGRRIEIPCGDRTLAVDWGRAADDPTLLEWR